MSTRHTLATIIRRTLKLQSMIQSKIQCIIVKLMPNGTWTNKQSETNVRLKFNVKVLYFLHLRPLSK